MKVLAINILLEPDATMLQHAEANNARLLKVFPKGFALDATHRPHITLIQRFVRTADLEKVYATAGKVLASANVNGMELEAFKYYYAPVKDAGVAGIVARPTPELLKLQQDVISAVAPFTLETGTMAAFVSAHDDPALDAIMIEYVSTFVPKMTGEYFSPHVSTGVASLEYLDKMLAEPFESFHLLAGGRGRLPTGPARHRCEETQRMGFETVSRSKESASPEWVDSAAETTAAGAFVVPADVGRPAKSTSVRFSRAPQAATGR